MQKKSRTIMKEVYDYAKNITPGDYGGISETKFCRDYGENPAPWRVGPFQILPDMTFAKERPFEDPTGIGWESHFIFNPSLIVKDDQLYLFYRTAPQKESLSSRIGLAVYQEGKGWEDLSGPPILYPTEDGETHGVEDPKVYFWNGRYYMFYQSVWQPEGEERQRILGDTPENWEVSCVTRLAVSNDLLHWEKKGLVLPYEISRGWCKGAVIPRDGNGCPVKIHGKFLMFVSEGCAGRQQVGYSEDMEHWEFREQNYLSLPKEMGEICEVACCITEQDSPDMVLDFFYRDNDGVFHAGQAHYQKDAPFQQLELGQGGCLAWGGLTRWKGKYLVAQGWDAPKGEQRIYFYQEEK